MVTGKLMKMGWKICFFVKAFVLGIPSFINVYLNRMKKFLPNYLENGTLGWRVKT